MREKFYINNIPVYRKVEDNGYINYRLYEYISEDDFSGVTIVINKQKTIEKEIKIVLDFISNECNRGSLGNTIKFKN